MKLFNHYGLLFLSQLSAYFVGGIRQKWIYSYQTSYSCPLGNFTKPLRELPCSHPLKTAPSPHW